MPFYNSCKFRAEEKLIVILHNQLETEENDFNREYNFVQNWSTDAYMVKKYQDVPSYKECR